MSENTIIALLTGGLANPHRVTTEQAAAASGTT